MTSPSTLVLFDFDWDRGGFGPWRDPFRLQGAGFDLFRFPSNLRLVGFDLERFVDRLARQAPRRGWGAVVSNHEQFGALAAALLAERVGWPGTPVEAVLACQHKLHARRVLQSIAPETNPDFAPLPGSYGDPLPHDLSYPLFVKPVKAAFSVLARRVHNRDELAALTRFGPWERWLLRRLVEPFERVVRKRLPQAGSAHRLMLEQPVVAAQYNLDGYVFQGEVRALGFVESVMYPGTLAFQRFVYPCDLPEAARARALEVAGRFLAAVGFDHGLFNLEFFYDAARDRLTLIEFNPRMAAQFSDLYRRVDGIDLHRLALELAQGRDPALLLRLAPTAGVAASFVYRSFDPRARPPMPGAWQKQALARAFPDALLLQFPKTPREIARDFKWIESYRYGILHLGGQDAGDLHARFLAASALLGWTTSGHRREGEAETDWHAGRGWVA